MNTVDLNEIVNLITEHYYFKLSMLIYNLLMLITLIITKIVFIFLIETNFKYLIITNLTLISLHYYKSIKEYYQEVKQVITV